MGRLEQPLLRGDGPAERAFHVAEQFAFQQRGGQGAAIAGQQRAVLAAAEPMDGPHEHLLAGAALAGEQDGAVGRRDAAGEGENPLHGPAFANDPLESLADFQFLPQGHVLPHQGRMFPCLGDDHVNWAGEKGLAI